MISDIQFTYHVIVTTVVSWNVRPTIFNFFLFSGAIIFGFMAFLPFTTDPLCIVAGIWQILAGCIVILIEAPFMCMFLDFVQSFSRMVDGRPVWQKAALYLV